MQWYYAVNGDRKGPLNEEDFQRLVQQGVITAQTLVWREGMAGWQPYAAEAPPRVPGAPPSIDLVPCAGCGQGFAQADVIPVAHRVYCAACKPLALQRLREGLTPTSAAEEIRKAHLKHEASIQSVGLLYLLGGIALGLIGLGSGLAGVSNSGAPGVGLGVGLIGLGAAQFWVGIGLRRLKQWSRIPVGIFSGLGLLGFPLGTLINGYILYLVFGRKGKMVFSDEYRSVMDQTPHIKYRTPLLVWILLGLLLAVIALGILGVLLRPA